MTEAEWLACADATAMLSFFRSRACVRRLFLFACACCRRVWHRLHDPRSRHAVEVTERFIEREAELEELIAARAGAEAAYQGPESHRRGGAGACAAFALALALGWNQDRWPGVSSVASQAALSAAECAALVGRNRRERKRHWLRGHAEEEAAQRALMRDIGGDLFRPITRPIWRSSVVTEVAKAAYDERILPAGTLHPARLAVLADALEDAGCSDGALLSHLRSPGPHVRGCWALDLVLGRA